MTRRIIRYSWLIGVLLMAALAAAQTEFSGEMVDLQKGETSNAKIYFGKDKLRIEPTKKDMRGGGAVIMNLTAQTTTVLMDQQHMYMEMPAQAAGQRNPYAYTFFRTGDVEAACADWVQQTHSNGGSCHKIGNDTVNGRSCVKYEGTNGKGDSTTFWIDPKLRFPIKAVGKNTNWELRNIQEGSQAASLFEVPGDYKKFEMPNMPNMGGMQRPQ